MRVAPWMRARQDIGHGAGQHYAVNVPLNQGIDDGTYLRLFKPV